MNSLTVRQHLRNRLDWTILSEFLSGSMSNGTELYSGVMTVIIVNQPNIEYPGSVVCDVEQADGVHHPQSVVSPHAEHHICLHQTYNRCAGVTLDVVGEHHTVHAGAACLKHIGPLYTKSGKPETV